MTVQRAQVSMQGQVVGELFSPPLPEPSVFMYGQQTPEAHAVSVTMPVSGQVYHFHGLHPIFAQNLPEGYLGDVLQRTLSKLHGAGELTLLAALGRHQVGRVVVSDPYAKTDDELFAGESLEQLTRSTNTALFEELVEKYALRSGVSGVQPKVLVPALASERSTLKTSGFIVKSWGDDYPQLAANEYFCLRVAQEMGLQVPDVAVSDDGKLLVMQRFDRLADGSWLGFEDVCVLQGLRPEHKYQGSYEKLLKSLITYVSPAEQVKVRREFLSSLLVSWAVGNGDAHLKNFGILYDQPFGVRKLAPVYDIVSTVVYLKNDVPALTLAGRKVWWAPEYLRNFARVDCGLSEKDVDALLKRLIKALGDVAVEITHYIDRHPDFAEVGSAMLAVFRNSVKQLDNK
ncbi:type II toxin-antitoxin system HipA family toxin [Cellvibrio sp. ARAG 10.3]|uniref:type II toxin-antitoxin system HipA family toxin n=1 Tax=Cellvibrio sp. ARAG 10.3 TaxID=3451358 RepID=UPI003F46A229